MISLILPYWDRQEAADKAFALLDKHYQGLSLEVVVVDDGNPVPFRLPETTLRTKILRLPKKDGPTSCIRAWNRGVEASSGDVIVLSCIEVLHEKPVLEEMVEELRKQGENGYVLAAAWCPEEGAWHCHSSKHPPQNSPGTGASFCAALHKSLFYKAGGFDEEYMDGVGYEDCDFINRLLVAGAKFVKRDDLVVIHPKSGASIRWPDGWFQKNFARYLAKWPKIPLIGGGEKKAQKPVNFVCLKAGTMYGANYVNTLYDMVRRNIPDGHPGAFYCITDDPEWLHPDVKIIPLPADLERWWGKLFMFKRGLFPDGSRCLFMDLDTLVVGSLNRLIEYDGQFATLRDFGGNGLGPAIIAWEAGEFAAGVWEEWVAQGKPRNPRGDQGWMTDLYQGRFPKMIDLLQDLYPGDFCSFKFDCDPMFPKGTKVVCFHGEPRPHNCTVEWVKNCWKVGGGTAAELEAVCNTHRDRIAFNVKSSMARGLPQLGFVSAHSQQAVLVGGGPSLRGRLRELEYRFGLGQTIFALNGAGKYLLEHGITPHHTIITDARPENVQFVTETHAFLASHCDPSLFDAARSATVFHVNQDVVPDALGEGEHLLISTGSTVGLIGIGIAHVLGYRTFHLYGYDSSYEDAHHAYPQPLNDKDAVIQAQVGGRVFKCAPWMVLQAQQFQSLAAQLADEGCIITVAGDGLLPQVAREMGKLPEAA